jgi:hypothetical protein
VDYASSGKTDTVFWCEYSGYAILSDSNTPLEYDVLFIVGRVPMGWDVEGFAVGQRVHADSGRIVEDGHCNPLLDWPGVVDKCIAHVEAGSRSAQELRDVSLLSDSSYLVHSSFAMISPRFRAEIDPPYCIE